MGNQTKLINDLLSNINGGVDVAAAYLGLSVSAFNDRRYKNKGTRFFSGDELLALQQLSGTTLVAEYYAEPANCMVIQKPDETVGTYDLFESMLSIGTARGEYEKYLAIAIADGSISDKEEAVLNQLCEIIVKRRIAANMTAIQAHKKVSKV